MNNKRKYIVDKFNQYGIRLTQLQAEQFEDYYQLLCEGNKKTNLTSITGFEDTVEKHFIDSVSAGLYYDMAGCRKIIDIGSGAGFPGIPLKIVYPQPDMTLLDSLGKRTAFLSDTVDKLGLQGINVIRERAEEAGRDEKHRERYDMCVSRAVAKLSVLCEYCTPFIRPGGIFIAYKTDKTESEITEAGKAIKSLGCEIRKTDKFMLGDMTRCLICVERTEILDERYPRRSGRPSTRPL